MKVVSDSWIRQIPEKEDYQEEIEEKMFPEGHCPQGL